MWTITVQFTPESKEVIEKAAIIAGQSPTDFVIAATTDRAHALMLKSDAIGLSARDHERVLAALHLPPDPFPALKRAADRYKRSFK